MEDRIAHALTKLFDRHRIVFWYDTKKELRKDYESLDLAGVEKVELQNNEYGLKYRMLRECPEQKFLLYREGQQPEDLANWLLDVQLSHGEFRTDQVAIWLDELGLGMEFTQVVQDHVEFFQAVKRKESLKGLLKPDDTFGQIRLKMLAVCSGCESRMDEVVESLLQEMTEDRAEKIRLIKRCGLDSFLWDKMNLLYGYKGAEPNIRDFAIELFKSCYAMGTGNDNDVKLNGDALVFLKRWKDSRQFEESFSVLSAECAEVLGIESDLGSRDFRDIIALDYFQLIDKKIISDLVKAVVSRTVSSGDVGLWVRQRRQSHWYKEYFHLYEAIDVAAQFHHALGEADLSMHSFEDGLQRYYRNWYRIDQLYRKFIYHMMESGQATLMGELANQIENLYVTNYLLKLGDGFQEQVDQLESWEVMSMAQQNKFFDRFVQPFLIKENKICVIISDALRYEVGEELLSMVRKQDRYGAEIEPMLSMLPSYTQLGMAALLPGSELVIVDNDQATVQVDGTSSQGTANRSQILSSKLGGRGQAVKAKDFMDMNRDDSRELIKANDVIYIYHNRIDHRGDKLQSEGEAFEAAEQALEDILRVVKKLTAANANNIIVTADHGFIYQNRALEESDFLSTTVEGDQVTYRDRRFVLGKGLSHSKSLHEFTSNQLGLGGEIEVRIPKSINRLRRSGSGSRFVHGGASLQEVIVPVLKINKKRHSDTVTVEVEILRSASTTITSGQLAVTLYQTEPATEKVQPRVLRAGIFTESGELISESHELVFDMSSEYPRERELPVRFVLTRKADEANGKEVILKLEEKHAGTSHYREYKSVRYVMRRSFTSDFDF